MNSASTGKLVELRLMSLGSKKNYKIKTHKPCDKPGQRYVINLLCFFLKKTVCFHFFKRPKNIPFVKHTIFLLDVRVMIAEMVKIAGLLTSKR